MWQCLEFLRLYPDIGWHGKSREQISPAWPRAYDDFMFLIKHAEELKSLVEEARANSKFYGKNRVLLDKSPEA